MGLLLPGDLIVVFGGMRLHHEVDHGRDDIEGRDVRRGQGWIAGGPQQVDWTWCGGNLLRHGGNGAVWQDGGVITNVQQDIADANDATGMSSSLLH